MPSRPVKCPENVQIMSRLGHFKHFWLLNHPYRADLSSITVENPDSSSTPKCQEKQLRDEAGAVGVRHHLKWDGIHL